MRRLLLAFTFAVCAGLAAPVTIEAAVIQCLVPSASCKPIALFAWDQDPFFTDDIFTVFNHSDSADAPTAGGLFGDVVVTLDPGGLFEFPMSLGDIGAGGQADSLGQGLFFGVVQVDLDFTFMSAPFALSLTGPATGSIYAEIVATAPEPSALLLLGSGAIVMRAIRRRRRC